MGVIVLKNGKELTVTNDFFQQVKEDLLLTEKSERDVFVEVKNGNSELILNFSDIHYMTTY